MRAPGYTPCSGSLQTSGPLSAEEFPQTGQTDLRESPFSAPLFRKSQFQARLFLSADLADADTGPLVLAGPRSVQQSPYSEISSTEGPYQSVPVLALPRSL